MPQEFKVKNGLIVDQGGATITGSVIATGGFTGSLQGTASFATTSSFALAVAGGGGGAAFPFTGSALITGSLGVTGSTSIIGIFKQGIVGNQATGTGSHAEGFNTTATGYASHAEGNSTTATGNYSHAEGTLTVTSGISSHAEGYYYEYLDEGGTYTAYNQATGLGSHAEGIGTIAAGEGSHAEGYGGGGGTYNNANAPYSHVEGIGTTTNGTGSHAEGNSAIASGFYSHAEGFSAQAYGDSSHAEGYAAITYGAYAHAEGFQSVASGSYSHAEGSATLAKGVASHAEGLGTVALGDYQHVQGQYNISSSAQSAFIIGNGTSGAARSNLVFASGSQFQITGSLSVTGSVISNTDGLNRLARYGTAISGSTIGTGVTAQTIVFSQLIPANTFVAGDIFRTYYRFRKLATNGNATHNILVNTSNAVAGATTLATLTANTVHNQMKRDFYIAQGNATTSVGSGVSVNIDDTSNTQTLSVINWAVDQYLIYTVTLNTLDSGYGLGYTIEQVL